MRYYHPETPGSGESVAATDPVVVPPVAPSEVPLTEESEITVGGETFKMGTLIGAQRKAEQLEEYRQRASRVIQGGELNEDREADLRYVLAAEGYSNEDVNGYVEYLKGDAPTEQPAATPGEAPVSQGQYQDPRVTELLQRQEAVERRVSDTVLEQLGRRLDESVTNVLDNNENIGVLLERTNALDRGEEKAVLQARESRRNSIQEAIQEQTLAQVQARKNRGETYRPEWFAEEAAKAADVVFQRYRTVIGDPQMLGRAPETDAGQDQVHYTKPPEDPKFERGDQPGNVIDKARNFAEGTLLHLAHQIETGGDSKV